MDTREWPLITFTILMQMAAGAFIVLTVLRLYAQRKAGAEQADRLADRALLAVVPALGLGLLASFFHLGTPLHGYLSVLRVGGSWLSREILFSVLFSVVAVLSVGMQWLKIASSTVRQLVAWLAVVLGLVMVFSMSSIYMLKTIPVWDTVFTPIAFFTTTFLLGSLAMGAALVANYAYVKRKDPECADVQCTLLRDALRLVAVVSILLLGVEFLTMPLQVAYVSGLGSAPALKSVALIAGQYQVVFALRLLLVFLGAGVLGMFVYRNAASIGRERMMGNLTYLAFLLVLVGEVLGRFLFYASFAKIGIL